jgi:hypothetical protein
MINLHCQANNTDLGLPSSAKRSTALVPLARDGYAPSHQRICPRAYGYWFFRFYYEVIAEFLQTLSKKFLPETDAAINNLLSFRVEVKVIAPIPKYT